MSDTKATTRQPGNGGQQLIYVVDDEPMLLELASVILEPQGYAVKTFRDPELVLEAFQAAAPRPELIISDYAMHTMNGMDLVTRLRAMEPRQKILLVSGTVGADVFANAPSKPNQFLAKPYQAHQLTEAVKSLIDAK
jgi:two-component system, cell cycle sensor histidine kinase and response regulator CckA